MDKDCQVTIDRFGRIRIPKVIRTELGLEPGTKLLIEIHHKELLLRPVNHQAPLVNKDGVLVIQSLAIGDLDDVERREREIRLREQMQRIGL